MDLGTIIGMLVAWGLVLYSVFSSAGPNVPVFIDVPSMLIVVGGAFGSVMTSMPLARFLKMGKTSTFAIFNKERSSRKLIEDLVGYAEIARRDGILSLENAVKDANDPFIVKGIQMAVDGTDPELIESILEAELEGLIDRHEQGKASFDMFAKYAPAYGMIGTLVGLVVMLMNMSDPAALGPAMAVALITTLYGSMIANMFGMPISDKLACRTAEEVAYKNIIIKGVMSIQSGDNPRIVEQKLMTYLPPAERKVEEKK